MGPSIGIVSDHSLFADGVATRLRQHLTTADLATVDPRQPDATARIVAAQPTVVLLDNSSPDIARLCRVEELLHRLPGLRIIRFDPAIQQVQVMTSQQWPVANVRDLAEMITA
jgi:DNA-binding NarL/FixJ family response regulator